MTEVNAMKKYGLKLLVLLLIVLLSVIGMAGAADTCEHSYTLHEKKICEKCYSVKPYALCELVYIYDATKPEVHSIGCIADGHGGMLSDPVVFKDDVSCTYNNNWFKATADNSAVPMCDLCHNYDKNTHNRSYCGGTVTEGDSNTVATLQDGTHLVNSLKCTNCGDIFTTLAHECKDNAAHEVPVCEVCYLDDDGRVHNPAAATPEDCAVCLEIIANQNTGEGPTDGDDSEKLEEPVCKHTTLINRYFTWVDAKQHRESSVCKDCGEAVESIGYHGTSASWHNGTVCLYCRTDENGVKHNWSNGECTVCPKPIPDGLNPEDGWYYEGGEKIDFTGLAEYNGSLFYVENGQWQKELDGLKLIGDEFWYLAGGQVQEHHGFALYDGEWFYLDGGKLDITASGLFQYDGEWFLVAAGRLVSERKGLAQLPNGDWYYIADGRMVQEYSGVVQWAGDLFEVANGKMLRWIGPGNRDYHGILNGWY